MGKPKGSKYVSFSDPESLQTVLQAIQPVDPEAEKGGCDDDEEENQVGVKVSDGKGCSLCGVQFGQVDEQRQHFKLDWHRYNIKRKLQNKAIVNEDEFNQLADTLNQRLSLGTDNDDAWDQVSLSGSESESETERDEADAASRRHPKFFFQNEHNQMLSVFKAALVDNLSRADISDAELVTKISALKDKNFTFKWGIFMLGGGHFAGAIFQNATPIVHKTFHCYTVRAKQGGSQSSADNKSGTNHPKSAGASLRRYNQLALLNHVRAILDDWKNHMKTCDAIFYRAVSGNRSVLFGEGYLDKKDPKYRTIPFPTRRATFGEVKRVHNILSSIQIHAESDNAAIERKRSPKKKSRIRRSKSRDSPKRSLPKVVQDLADATDYTWSPHSESAMSSLREYENSAPLPKTNKSNKKKQIQSPQTCELVDDVESEQIGRTEDKLLKELKNDLVTACESGNAALLKKCLETTDKEDLVNLEFGNDLLTPLHIAAMKGSKNLISILLENGADPAKRSKRKQVPYFMCSNKETRIAFRRYQADHPDQYDYKAAQIPVEKPLTAEEENAQLAKKREKKKAQKAVKKEKEKLAREEEEGRRREEDEKQRFLNLSDREKRALAAERRILGASGSISCGLRCFLCGSDLAGKVPFTYMEFRFCTTNCLKEHRQKPQS